jgi:hypothetical protein
VSSLSFSVPAVADARAGDPGNGEIQLTLAFPRVALFEEKEEDRDGDSDESQAAMAYLARMSMRIAILPVDRTAGSSALRQQAVDASSPDQDVAGDQSPEQACDFIPTST